jgi:hypothetical protein
MEIVKHPISDRVFTFCGFEPYQKLNGEWTELKVWQTTCKTCNGAFTVKTPVKVKHYMDSHNFQILNCEKHRRM